MHELINKTVKDFIKKYNLSGKFIIGFSGGFDSMCLLDIMYKSGFDIVAAHLNHNWRGKESFEEAKNCENFAKSRGIIYYSEILPDSVKKNETSAREARYKFFEKCAKKFNSNIVLTAHNFDDNAETLLYRIIKGTSVTGLCAIAEHRDIFYRPLLKVPRSEIEKYCADSGLIPNQDSSNNDTKYKRNLIRHKILPVLKEINPKVTEALNSLSETAKEYLCCNQDFTTELLINAAESQQKMIIRNILVQHHIEYDRKKIEYITDFINKNKTSKSGKKISLTKDIWLFVNNKKTEIITQKGKNALEIKITQCGNYTFEDKIFTIEPYNKEVVQFPADKDYKAYISAKTIDFTLRHRKDGDRIFPLGSNGSQKLKKYLNEKKIPAHEKDNIVLLCKGNEIVWAAGIGINEKFKVTNNASYVLKLKKEGLYEY